MQDRENTELALRGLMTQFRNDWQAFNDQVVGFPVPLEPTMLSPERARFRGAFLQEEQNEFHLACGKNDLDGAVDALIDMIYVAVGTLGEMGVLTQPTWAEVQRANMMKRRGLTKRSESGGYDAIKPEGWKAPSHLDYLTITARDVSALLAMKRNECAMASLDDGKTVWYRGGDSKPEQLILELDVNAIPTLETVWAMKPYIGERPKIVILGHGRHGKDTVCELLANDYDLKFTSSSWFCAERVVMPVLNGQFRYKDAEACFNDRHNHRALWYDIIRDFNRPDATALGRAIFEANDVYCGLRSKAEFHALKNAGVFDYAIWVDASDRVEAEDKSSCTVEPWMADFVLDNNGSLEDLKFNLSQLMGEIL